MTRYNLYLESGPQKKRTLVHVPQLLGLNYFGATVGAFARNSRAVARVRYASRALKKYLTTLLDACYNAKYRR